MGKRRASETSKGVPPWAAALAVAFLVAAALWPVTSNSFIELYDDGPYVLQNARVRAGLSLSGVAWAATSVSAHNWHPLTWMSHMADVQAFGLDPWGHHLTSLLLHAATAGLLVLLFHALGAPVLAAAAAGAIFGLHPLRLESVAWVAERKDVLSGLLGLASLLAWVRYARTGRRSAWAWALALFTLGLLAKPMLVTLPAILLLLDAWPLGRLRPDADRTRRETWRREARDLAPFFPLSAVVAVITVFAQGSTGSFAAGDIDLGQRVANAATSVFGYLAKMAWPSGLAVYYVHPRRPLLSPLPLLALAGILGVTLAAIRLRRTAPWLLVGWLWYLAMLAPVIGIVQVGRQAMADRYTYLPGVGILLAATWSVLWLVERFPGRAARWTAMAATAVATVALGATSRAGAEWWRNSAALFTHAREVTGPNSIASNGLGTLAASRRDFGTAEGLFRESISADPHFGIGRQNLAALLGGQGRMAEAWQVIQEALRVDPTNGRTHFIAGTLLQVQGRLPEAATEYEEALRRMPDHPLAQARLRDVRQALAVPGPPRQGERP